MTPDRWQRIGELFEAVRQVNPDERETWLHTACANDETLRAELLNLLAMDEWADHAGFLDPPERSRQFEGRTGSRPTVVRLVEDVAGQHVAEAVDTTWSGEARGFTPHDVIRAESNASGSVGSAYLARQRLRGLTITYVLITLLMLGWKYVVAGDPETSQSIPYLILLAVLGGIAFRLSMPRPISRAHLEAMELGTIGFFATGFAIAQYRTMLDFSMSGESTRAQLVMSHRVLITTVLILSYGVYAPPNWRRAALVVGTIALLPFATLFLLYLRHPKAMSWLERMGAEHGTKPLSLLGFEAMLLLILAVGAVYWAHTTRRLHRQVREAKQLGQYRLGRKLGAGGMGEVYLAEHRFLKRPCALKLVRDGLDAGASTIERFEREVRLTATLSHPNTVEIYDYGRTEDGTYYYVMEFLPGLSLEDLVRDHGPLPPGRVVYLLRQVCLALREAHAVGLIHRDIKPSNIFAARRGGVDDVAKLLDFGLVRAVAESGDPRLSDEGQILGTPLFMSPEQAMGRRDLDGRSDIYSLGAVAYYLLTGKAPFHEGGAIEVLIALARDPVASPSTLRDGIPEDLERVILKCLAKKPEQRYQNAESLALALGQCMCSEEWDQEMAAHWWKHANEP